MPHTRTPPRLQGFDYSRGRTYFITFVVWDRLPVFADDRSALSAQACLMGYRERSWYWLLAYCVMPDHIHALLRTRKPGLRLATIVTTLKNQICRSLRESGSLVKWQPGFYDRVLRDLDDPGLVAKYVVENPVRAGLVKASPQYRYGAIVDRWF
jgi:REP-associated tyrosine transposase